MSMSAVEQEIQTINIQKEIEIAAPIEIAFEAMLEEIGPEGQMPDGKPFPMVIEPWPGGRWYRDLGDNAGHLWGHVQVIKPPTLLELCGPMFMSFPVAQPRPVPADGRRRRHAPQIHAPGDGPDPGTDSGESGSGWDYRLDRILPRSHRVWWPSGERGRTNAGDRPHTGCAADDGRVHGQARRGHA